jgi:hypothetical protein
VSKLLLHTSHTQFTTNAYFRSDSGNAYGGVSGIKVAQPSGGNRGENTKESSAANRNLNQAANAADFWLFQIQSTVLM